MKVWFLTAVFLAGTAAVAGTPGSFRGTIIDEPRDAVGKNWIYVQSRNGMARRADISSARVTSDDAPAVGTALMP